MSKLCGIFVLLSVLLLMMLMSRLSVANTYTLERGSDLQAVIDYASDRDTIVLGIKDFIAQPIPFVDSLCGNCENAQTPVETSYGFIIRGKGLIVRGLDREGSVLITGAGYGVLLVDADGTEISDLTITGGRRSDDGNATDGAVVVRRSQVLLENMTLRDNDHRSSDSTVVVGVGGIIGREGAEITVRNCLIRDNGWDGVALYRGASAVITDCRIQDGRGAGIGVTWDATSVVMRNEISGYWKGIGSFGTATLVARNNIVHDNLGWGIIATGQSQLDAVNNLVYHNGNCGVAPWSTEARGRFINNVITSNGWRDQWVCPCVGVWNYGDWAKWTFRNNIVWGNKAGDYVGIWEQAGINGNLNADPMFIDSLTFEYSPDSPVWHAGDTTIFNLDGSRSHIGHLGGPNRVR